jgi:hypothetical protein
MPCWLLAMTFHNSIPLPEEIAILTLVSANESLHLFLTIMNPHILSLVSYVFQKAHACTHPRNTK